MGTGRKLIKMSGIAPGLANSESLFDVLFSESELSSEAKEIFESLRDTLAYGGDKLGITIEHFGEAKAARTKTQPSGEQIFEVLALDVATILPAITGSAPSAGTLTGHQIWMCKAADDSDVEGAWYKRALVEYFNMPPGGSLLTFPGIRQNLGRWWLLRPGASAPDCPVKDSITLENIIIHKDSFPPVPVTTHGFPFRERFDQYGAAVFKELSKIQTEEETKASVVIWVYIGPPAQAGENSEPHNLWGVSVFAVLRPAKLAPVDATHWLSDPAYKRRLLRAVGQLYLYLTSAAYKTVEYGHRRLIQYKKNFETNVAQAVAHEFKNLTQDISSLGGLLDEEFFDVIRDVKKNKELAPELLVKLDEAMSSLRQLSNLSRLTSAVALATYWLTTPEARGKIVFKSDPEGTVFEAAVHLALALCKEVRPDWVIQGPQLKDVRQILSSAYGTSELKELVDRLDVALLLFVVSEPVRNLRSNNTERPEVYIHTERHGRTLYIYQKTFERGAPRDHHSRGAERINRMLHAGYNMTGHFAKLDETVRVVSSTAHQDGQYEVVRRTEIEVFGIPFKAT
jgi:hypothetical protein